MGSLGKTLPTVGEEELAANLSRILSLDGFGGLGGQIEMLTSRGEERAQAKAIGNQFGRPAIINRPFAG